MSRHDDCVPRQCVEIVEGYRDNWRERAIQAEALVRDYLATIKYMKKKQDELKIKYKFITDEDFK